MKKGFTLIEILVVIVIVAIMAAIAIPMLIGALDESKKDEASIVLTRMGEAHRTFRIDYPKLTLNARADFNEADFYLRSECLQDDESPAKKDLVNCGYMEPVKIKSYSYNFYLCDPDVKTGATGKCCNPPSGTDSSVRYFAAMQGTDGAGSKYAGKCFAYTNNNEVVQF